MAAKDHIIAFNNTETGSLSLRIPVWDDPTRIIENDDEFLEFIRVEHVPAGMTGVAVPLSEFKSLDRYFRNAWELRS